MTESNNQVSEKVRDAVGDRFERLPFTGYQRKLVAILALCYLVDAVDLQLLAYLLAPLSQDLGLTAAQSGIAASSVFVGMAVGATVAGALADRFGRRVILVSTMVLWGVASLLTAFAWDLGSFVAFRILTGVGLGAELPVAFALLAELVPAARRARLTSWMVLAGGCGMVVFNLLALGMVNLFGPGAGWRIMFGIMIAVAGLAMYVRRQFPESPRWLESRGRFDEADAVMSRIEAEVERAYGRPLPDVVPVAVAQSKESVRHGGIMSALFGRAASRQTLLGWSLWILIMFPYYGISTWVGKLLVDRGMSVSNSIVIGVLMGVASLPAVPIAGKLLDRFGRKFTFVAALVLATVGALAYGNASSFWLVVLCGTFMQMGLLSVALTLNTYTPELFATKVRATGVGTAQMFGRIVAIFAPLTIPVIMLAWGYNGAFILFGALFALGAVCTVLIGPETKAQTVEQLSH